MSKSEWIAHGTSHPEAWVNLILFPYAGGSPSMFAPWKALFPDWVQLMPVLYPGRELRRDDPMPKDVVTMAHEFVDQNLALFERPYALFGHCTGVVMAYEVARYVHERFGRMPACFIASGSESPRYAAGQLLGALDVDDDELVARMMEYGLVGPDFAANQNFLAYYLPIYRRDLKLMAGYQVEEPWILDCPVHLMQGDADPVLHPEGVSDWDAFCALPPQRHVFPGPHFYLNSCRETMASELTSYLGAALAPTKEPVRYLRNQDGSDEYPVLYPQDAFLDFSVLSNFNMAVSACMRIRGKLDLDRFRAAVQYLYDANDVLRARMFRREDGSYVQKFLETYQSMLAEEPAQGTTSEERLAWAIEQARKMISAPWPELDNLLFRVRLFRIDEDDRFLVIVAEHCAFDGASMSLVLNQLFAYYNDPATAPRSRHSFREHTLWHAAFLQSEEGREQRAGWEAANGAAGVMPIPGPDGSELDASNEGILTQSQVRAKIDETARTLHTSAAMLELAALYLAVARECGTVDPTITFTFANRCQPERVDVAGPFVGMLTQVCHLDEGQTMRAFVAQCLHDSSRTMRYADVCNRMYNVVVTFHNFDMSIVPAQGLAIEPYMPLWSHRYKLPVWNFWIKPDSYLIEVEFDPDLVSASCIKRILDYSREALELFATGPEGDAYEFAMGTSQPQKAATRTVIEQAFGRELGMRKLDGDSSFFDLGGNSLKAASLVEHLREDQGIDLLISDIYEHETVEDLAAYIAAREGGIH